MYSLRLFGGLALEGPSGPLRGGVAQRRRLALLAMLGVAGERGVSRDKLAGYLWPESDEAGARHLLSDSVYVLRKALGEEEVHASGAEAVIVRTSLIYGWRPHTYSRRIMGKKKKDDQVFNWFQKFR